MNEPPGARMRVGLSALTVAEYFREDLQQDVLLFIDNIFRFGRLTSAVGYQPTLATEMGWVCGYSMPWFCGSSFPVWTRTLPR